MKRFHSLITGALHLLYPEICHGCGSDILAPGNLICARCTLALPATHYAAYAQNPFEKVFWGRLPVQAAHAEFYFSKGSIIQELVHQLKYKGNREIGHFLGECLGRTLLTSTRFSQLDALVPLPLFPEKERKRGYNQAAIICNGMSAVMNLPVLTHALTRERFTSTQTKKQRDERWENVEGSFTVPHTEQIAGRHILLVDDVVTTGATFEAAGRAVLQVNGTRLSLASVAIASK